MTRIAVIHHLQQPFLGNAAAPLGAVEEHFRGALPVLDGLDGLVSFGGEQDAWDPALAPEVELIAEAVAREIPFLGVCLGAQLLARATGGENVRLERRLVTLAPADRDRGGSRPGRDPARRPARCTGTRTASSRRRAPSRSTHGRTAAARRASASARRGVGRPVPSRGRHRGARRLVRRVAVRRGRGGNDRGGRPRRGRPPPPRSGGALDRDLRGLHEGGAGRNLKRDCPSLGNLPRWQWDLAMAERLLSSLPCLLLTPSPSFVPPCHPRPPGCSRSGPGTARSPRCCAAPGTT